MPKRTNVDELVELSYDEIDHRIAVCKGRIEERIARCQNEERDFTQRELDLSRDDGAELAALRDAIDSKSRDARLAEARAARAGCDRSAEYSTAIQTAIDHRAQRLSPLAVSAENLDALERARAEYRTVSVVEHRAALKTTDMGTAVEYAANGLQAPNTLWRLSGIPTTEPPAGYKATVPLFTLPAAAALVSEGNPHGEYDQIAPDAVQLARTGAWSDLTAEAFISTSLAEISAAHARIIARDLDLATVAKIEQAPGDLTIDEALATVAAEAAADVSRLWIVGAPAAVASLAGNATFAATNASDVGSYATAYGGARIYVTPTASADLLTVFFPAGFRAFATPLASGVVVDPTTGAQRFGQWQIFGVGQSLAGAAVTVDLGGS